MISKLSSVVFILFFTIIAHANKVSPQRYNTAEVMELSATIDIGDSRVSQYNEEEDYKNHGFLKGRIDDVYYNQVLWCSLNDIGMNMAHELAITKSGQTYEYLDAGEYYKILSQGQVTIEKTATTLEVSDSNGGKLIFTYQSKAKGYAQVGFQNPILQVQGNVSCIASPIL